MYNCQFTFLSHLSRSYTMNILFTMQLECLDQLEAHWDFALAFQFLTRSVCLLILPERSLNPPNIYILTLHLYE